MDFTPYNERTITTKEDYLEELDKVRSLGYAVDNEEELSGVFCLGVPLLNYTGHPCGAIWISAQKDRLTKESLSFAIKEIKSIGQRISMELGFGYMEDLEK